MIPPLTASVASRCQLPLAGTTEVAGVLLLLLVVSGTELGAITVALSFPLWPPESEGKLANAGAEASASMFGQLLVVLVFCRQV